MQPVFSLTATDKHRFAEALLAWFSANARDLPWRKTYDPYSVWVAEIMLQQTQMGRGVAFFTEWMRRFPTIASVAQASEENILKAWEGLGYYRRARNLHAAAAILAEQYEGRIPRDIDAVRALPGIGEYTAAAVLSIAYNEPYAAVDANVLRIFSRICDIDVPMTHPGVKGFVTRIVSSLIPQDSPRSFTQALMELGALVCTKTPQCDACPIAVYCEAKRLGTIPRRPKKEIKITYSRLEMSTAVLLHEGRVLLQKRPPYGVWAGLWETPGGCLEPSETPEQALVREVAEETELPIVIKEKIAVIPHAYTTCRVTMHAYVCEMPPGYTGTTTPVLHAATEALWATPESVAGFTFPAGHRKLWELLRKRQAYGF